MPVTRATDQPTDERASGSKAVITLAPAVAATVRRMGQAMGGVTSAEVVRRGLQVLDEMLKLSDDEELVVRNKRTNDIERLRFSWNTFQDA